jgi:hypothetical protein
MTRRRRTTKERQAIKLQLATIIRDIFDNNGQLVTHDQLAREHVSRNASLTAYEDVQQYGGPAVVHLRNDEYYAIVPVTDRINEWTGDSDDESVICNTVAGLGAGGSRIGWYHPMDKDDWLWVYYIGHLGSSAMSAVFHAAQQDTNNPRLLSAKGQRVVAARSIAGVPIPPGKVEAKVLQARLDTQ